MFKGQHTGMILTDLQKAFDTLDHDVLVKKKECVGFKSTVIKWFKSCLSNKNVLYQLKEFSRRNAYYHAEFHKVLF